MKWWERNLVRYGLRYVLSKTGLLDEQAIDLNNLDISFGRQSVLELKDVRLNIPQLTKYAQLPPSLRIETARVLLLRLTFPVDFLTASVVIEVEGLELVLRLGEDDEKISQPEARRNRLPTSARAPQHRKTQRRLHSPPPGPHDRGDGVQIPSADEIVQAFLLQEPKQEREELEATLAASSKAMDESFTSESSEGGEVGTGAGVTIPAFLTSHLQNLVNRVKVQIKNVQIRIESDVTGETNERIPLALRLRVGAIELDKLETPADALPTTDRRRVVNMRDISLELLSDSTVLADLSDLPSQSSAAKTRSFAQGARNSEESFQSAMSGEMRRSSASTQHQSSHSALPKSDKTSISQTLQRSTEDEIAALANRDGPAHITNPAETEARGDSEQSHSSDLDIQAGDDNISWGSRRSRSDPPSDDLWKSMVSEDDLPDSLIIGSDRGPISQVHSSRGSSPSAAREKRMPPALSSTFQGTGSWPRLEDNLQRHRSRHHQNHGPGSWPALNQSQHSAFEPLAQVLTAADSETTDNKRAALEQTAPAQQSAERVSPPLSSMSEADEQSEDEDAEGMSGDMLESRVFSHEEAQSMYMSAMTNSPTMDMPGGWGAETQNELPKSTAAQTTHTSGYASECDGQNSGNVTPRAETSRVPTPVANDDSDSQVAQELLRIDWISISVPTSAGSKASEVEEAPFPSVYGAHSAQAARAIPGAFSMYSETSKRRGTSSIYGEGSDSLWAAQKPSKDPEVTSSESSIDVRIGTIDAQVDLATGRLLYAFSMKTSSSLKTEAVPQQQAAASSSPKPVSKAAPAMSLRVQRLGVSLNESMDRRTTARRTSSSGFIGHGIIGTEIEDIGFSMSGEARLTAGSVKVLLGGQDLLTFTQDSNSLSKSQISSVGTPAIEIAVNWDKTLANKRPVTEVVILTTTIVVLLDLAAIDESFNSFGGLSGVLELGGSILSEGGASSPIAAKSSKGVRFAGDADPPTPGPEVKTNLRINGLTVTLKAAPCSAVLQTSTVKAVHREAGVIATVERISLSGPILPSDQSHAPISTELATVRLEYILKPQDKDLERLLCLLTPSKDKYDSDDDILIDTLLRQRRKGGLLRIVVADVKVRVDNWDCLSTLEELGKDLAKLSAVTKYLPEDDRPGMLSLIRVKDAEARLPVNERFGTIRLTLQDLHLAHVGLPALLAFSISSVNASQADGPTLVHALLPLAGSEGLPMIMARMLGDEEEPTIKLKLFNFCFEYSVPVILDMTSMDKEADVEEFVTGLAQSIAGLAMEDRAESGSSVPSSTPAKKTKLSLLIHDSAIGLSPQRLQSKVLLVLTETHFTTVVPPEEVLSAKLDLRKASIFVTDRVLDHPVESTRTVLGAASTTQRLADSLITRGYVSVGSVMSATITVRAEESSDSSSKMIEVDVKNELFLLETCADSTQTLIATLNGLVPPTPPSKQPKYLNQPPTTLEDLMASFTGDPFEKPDMPPETLFDVEADQDDEPDMLLGMSGLSETADLLAESGMNSSLYGPVSGVFGMADHDEDESTTGEDYSRTVESLLEEEEPFEMPNSPTDMYLNDAALLRDLKRQCKPVVRHEPVDLGLYEIEDLGYDALGSGQQALGTYHRFNAPFPGSRGGREQQSDLPFRLRLRDCHVIWHIYDGYDWQRTRDGIVEAVEQFEIKAEERRARRQQTLDEREEDESVVGDLLFNSIYIAVPSDHDAQDLRRQINRNIDDMISETESVPVSGMSRPASYSASGQARGPRKRRRLRLGRSRNHKIAFELKGVSADVLVFPPGGGDVVSSVDLRIKDLEIFDKVPTSTWRKFLTHLNTDSSTREMSKPMFHIQLDNVKTLESHSASEIVLKVSVLPLRLHVDQDALDFITRFFEFKDGSAVDSGPPDDPPFIQRVEIDTVDMCLDYKPKNIDYVGLRSGRTTEFMNFITLDASNIRLKHAIVYGLRGFDTLHQTLNDVWMPDIQRNQLPTILAGLAPVRGLVNLGSGVRDVVAIPIREYKKDGRIVRSIQKGAFQFGKTTASELARLGAKVALGTQTVLSNAEHFLSSDAASSSRRPASSLRTTDQGWHDIASDDEEPEQRAVSAYANQPLGVLPGLASARRHLEHDLLTAKDALIAVRGEFFESRGPGGAVAAVARHAPTVILRPIIGATRAVGTTLLGVGNQIDRGNVRKVEDVSPHLMFLMMKLLLTFAAEIQTTIGIRMRRWYDSKMEFGGRFGSGCV